ncbi:MAG TPA: hypothetical protein VFR14_02620, partial [Candidatus Limnocylindrales bacterium]|nr:hypothetical protein [Candidatus Limnocylindrales bacterium]
MTLRTRKYVVLAITVLVGVVYGLLAGSWNDVGYYGGAAGLLVVICAIGMPWMEFAPDGAFR